MPGAVWRESPKCRARRRFEERSTPALDRARMDIDANGVTAGGGSRTKSARRESSIVSYPTPSPYPVRRT